MWSTSCCWEGKGSVRTAGVGLLFKNLLISSRRGNSFMKWSPPHNRQGYLAFLFPLLSFSRAVGLGFSCWFMGFLFFPFPFFLLSDDCILWIAFTSVETVGLEGTVMEGIGFLVAFTADRGWIEPITPSTGVYAGGLDKSMLGRGAWGIRPYKVLDWEYTKSRYCTRIISYY